MTTTAPRLETAATGSISARSGRARAVRLVG